MGEVQGEGLVAAFYDPPNQVRAKRARLNSPESEQAGSPRNAGPLVFEKEVLGEGEEIDPDEPLDAVPRQVVIQFVAAKANRLEGVLQNSPLLQAIKASRQWRWERSKDGTSLKSHQQQTDCMIALIPGSTSQDFSFVIRVGYWTGWRITKYLEYGESIEQTPADA